MTKTGRPDYTTYDSMAGDEAQGISSPHRDEAGVDRLFIPYVFGTKLSDYWVGDTLRHGFHAFYSKRHFQYGCYYMDVQFDTMCATRQLFGQEPGPGVPATAVLFDIIAPQARIFASGAAPMLDLTAFLPANYDTARNIYIIKINQNNALFWINFELKAVILFNIQVHTTLPEWENNQPYALGGCFWPASFGPMMIGMEGDVYIEWAISHNGIVATDGVPITPLALPLYTEDTATHWDDVAIAAGSLTSHPLPIWGYDRKTICFRANGAGALSVQVYVMDAWREVDNIAIVADTLQVEVLDFEAPIVRCVFTPAAYPTTITEAVAYLS